MNADLIRGLSYIVASVFFILGLKMLSSQASARRGNLVSAIGMLIAVVTTLTAMAQFRWIWIVGAVAVGGLICSTVLAAWPACWSDGRSFTGNGPKPAH